MKYAELEKIATFLQKFRKIRSIMRVDDNALCVDFEGFELIFDLNRTKSSIYTAKLPKKPYNAPFDLALKRHFSNTQILDIKLIKNNRILLIKSLANRAYKRDETWLWLEFTGKNTNAIITNTDEIVLCALRYTKGVREIKTGEKLPPLKPFKMDDKIVEIRDFKSYFEQNFKDLNDEKLRQIKGTKLAQIDKKIHAFKGALESLENEKILQNEAENLSQKAQLLTANLYKIKDFEREFFLDDFSGEKIFFKLDEAPKIWANNAFKKSKKLRQKAANLHLQKDNLNEQISFLNELKALINAATTAFECEVLLPKKDKKGEKKARKNATQTPNVARFEYNDFVILVGKNEKGNEFLLKNSKKNDIWFHIKDYASAHAFIISNKQKIPPNALEFAARMCVSFSKLNKGSYFVDYTERKNVSVRHKAFVEYRNFHTLRITRE